MKKILMTLAVFVSMVMASGLYAFSLPRDCPELKNPQSLLNDKWNNVDLQSFIDDYRVNYSLYNASTGEYVICFDPTIEKTVSATTTISALENDKLIIYGLRISGALIDLPQIQIESSNVTLANASLTGNHSGTAIRISSDQSVTIGPNTSIKNFSTAIEALGANADIIQDEFVNISAVLSSSNVSRVDLSLTGKHIKLNDPTKTDVIIGKISDALILDDISKMRIEMLLLAENDLDTTVRSPLYPSNVACDIIRVGNVDEDQEVQFTTSDGNVVSIESNRGIAYYPIIFKCNLDIELTKSIAFLFTLNSATDALTSFKQINQLLDIPPSVMGPIASIPEGSGADSGGVTIISEVEAGDAGGDKALETSDQIGQGASAKSGCSNVSTSDTMVPLAQLLIYLTMFSTIPAFVVIRNRKSRK